ncbi:MAG TPA: FtsX-like permease family protein [Conexibacter sp.]|jgi:putative ABC transport system permease protein|nr:FtsX-like permease family protein [Conexibacter sp.]
MRPGTVLLFYWWRLRIQPLQELLAATGIAAGVALLFAVQVANSSIGGSVEQLVHGITGQFSLQVAAYDSRGFTEAFTAQVERIDGVRLAAPVLEQRVGIAGARDHANVDLVGVTNAISDAGGPLVNGFGGRFGPRLADALLIPAPLAARVGAQRDRFVTLATRVPVAQRVPISAILDRSQIGTAIDSPLVVAPLAYVQRLTGLPGRVTRILIAVRPGTEEHVRSALTTLVGGRLAVERSDVEVGYVEQAATPNNQSTGLFAGICAIVGILFTFNAMLLTVPERRRLVAELRIQGYKRRQVMIQLAFEATVLGVVASLAGLVLGDLLSRHVFHAAPGYLSFAFPVGGQRVVHASSIVLALAGGILATFIATAPLLRDLFSSGPVDSVQRGEEEPGEAIGARARTTLAVSGSVLLAGTTLVVALVPQMTMVCIALLAVAMLALVPALLSGVLTLVDRMIDGVRGSSLPIAVMELRSSLTRATALAATGALALFGTVAIQGAHGDLLHGLDVTAAAMLGTTDVWVTANGDENILMTTSFALPDRRALLASGVVSGVRAYRGEFLDMAGRRVWVMARPPQDRPLISPTDVQEGGVERATQLVRSGGWAALSASIADRLHVGVGDRFTIPTPTGSQPLRVAAIVSNLGWAPGSLVLNGNDYRRWWPDSDVTALEVDLKPGIAPSDGKAAIQRALPAGSPLLVETQTERKARFGRLERQGLNRLSQISTLLLIAAVLAMGAAMAGTVWQQRRRLATLRMQGYGVGRILRLLLTQAFLVLAAGAVIGASFGLYGQALGTRWLQLTTGFPTIFSLAVALAFTTLATVGLLALVVVLIPGYFAARTGPSLAFRTD